MKYIVEANEHVQMISLIAVREGTAIMITGNVETFQTADKAIDEAYQKGFEAGQHEATTLEYQQGLEEGKKQARAQAHLDVCHDIERVAHGNYQQGLDDAWNAARKIVTWPDRSLVNSDTFDLDPGENIFTKYSASRAIEKLKAYEEQQKADEIKVGDEVRNTLGLMDNAVGFVIGITIEGDYNVSRYIDGKFKTGTWRRENCVKTGMHSDAVVQLLAEMEGEQQSCSTCKHNRSGHVQCIECCNGYNKWEPKEGAE